MIDTYSIYCQWCKDHHQTPPTREWWNKSVSQPRPNVAIIDFQSDFEFDVETERREGYAYDNL